MGTVGKALPWMEVKIVSPEGETLPAGEEGEVLVRVRRSCTVTGNAQRQPMKPLIRTAGSERADIASIQSDGFIRICDRIKT